MELRKVKLSLWIAALVALFVAGVAAASLAVEPSPVGDDAGSASFASNIVAAYPDLNLSVEYVEGLRTNDLGWGEIVIAASLASASGKTLDEVIALADSGLGWGDVATSLGVDTRGLGQSIRGVIGNSGKSKVDDAALDDAAAEELLNSNFGLTQQELEQLAESGIKKQDVLVALSAAVAANDPATFKNIIRLRQENRNWQQVFETIGVDPKGIRNIETAMIRSEVRTQLRERLKEFQNLKSGRPEPAGLASGGGSEVADDHEQADDDHGAGSQGQQADKDDQDAGDKDDQNAGDNDDQDAGDNDAGHGHGHAGHGSGGSSGGGGSKGKK